MSRVVLVTGGNRGLGRETARQLAIAGDTVIVTARNRKSAEQTVMDLATELGPAGRRLVPQQLDVTSPDSVLSAREALERDHRRLDGLVNNAATHYDTWQKAAEADLDLVRDALETNLFGAWRTTTALLPLLRASAHPRVVNVSSESGSLTLMRGGTPAYQVSKAALNAFTRTLADELRHEGILVNAVCPGWLATDMGGPAGAPVSSGVASVRWALDLPDDGPTGGFFQHGKPLPW